MTSRLMVVVTHPPNFFHTPDIVSMQPPPDPLIMEDALRELRAIVDEQAEDAALWHVADHTEGRVLYLRGRVGYLQHALRKLHYVIERATRWV